jgi:AMMECR1 domain-containing protein
LVNFEKGKKWDQWEVGKHGIIIDFTDSKGRGTKPFCQIEYGGTFLPEVAAEQGWDKITTLKYLIRKAGYSRNPEDVLEKVELTTYESSKAKLTYSQYKPLPN